MLRYYYLLLEKWKTNTRGSISVNVKEYYIRWLIEDCSMYSTNKSNHLLENEVNSFNEHFLSRSVIRVCTLSIHFLFLNENNRKQ